MFEGRSVPWFGCPADLHEVLESFGAGRRDGETKSACPHAIDDGRVLKLLHGREEDTMVTTWRIISSNQTGVCTRACVCEFLIDWDINTCL